MLTRKEIEQAMGTAARRYAETHDPNVHEEIVRLADQLAVIRHVEALENALATRDEIDLRTLQVYVALAFLAERASAGWPFVAFRNALYAANKEGRWQSLNAALNGIKRAVGLVDGEH